MLNLWMSSLTTIQKGLWFIAIFFSAIFIVQILLTLLGLDSDDGSNFDVDVNTDVDVDADIGGENETSIFGYFTIRNAIAFFLGFSWTAIGLLDLNLGVFPSIIIGILLGLIMVIINLILLRLLYSMNAPGNLDLQNAIGKTGTVSLTIPANQNGCGKISVSFHGRTFNVLATTQGGTIDRGKFVKIVNINGNQVEVVEN